MNYEGLTLPKHLTIIMDGNGRWATERGLTRSEGHLEGSKTLEKIALYAYEKGIKILSVFAFSTENFKRSKEEVGYLMDLFVNMLNKRHYVFKEKDVKVIFSGRRELLRKDVLAAMDKITNDTANNKSGILNICLNYSGQDEIVDATKNISRDILAGKIKIEDIDRHLFHQYLYQDLPDIDFVIRTSGENRISNFMLWQMAYAELYFPKIYFPAFTTADFDEAILEFNRRNRRFGGNETKSN